MTVASSVSRVSYSGNGSTQNFAVPFYFLENAHLQVVLRSSTGVETTQIITTNYTVTGAGNPAGGQVSMVVAPPTGNTLVITRNVPVTQDTDYQANDPFPAESHERALDKLTMISQQSSDVGNRSIKFPSTDSISINSQVPPNLTRANKMLGFGADGSVAISNSTIAQVDAAVGAALANPPTNAANLFYSKYISESPPITIQARIRQGAKNVKDYGALGDGTGRTPADDGVDISTASWNTWDGRAFKTNLPWSPFGTGGTFVPIRAKPFSNDDTWDFIGISLALWDEEGSYKSTYIPAGNYVINLTSTTSKGLYYNGLLIMKGMEQAIFGDGPYETHITTKEDDTFFGANNVGTKNAYSLFCFYRIGGPPTNIYEMAIVGPFNYPAAGKNLTLLLCQNINGVTFRELWLSGADEGIVAETSSGDSHARGITTEFLFSNSIYTDASSEISVDFCNIWASATVIGQRGVNGLGRVSVTNCRFVQFYAEGVKGANGIVSNNYFAGGNTILCTISGDGVINNNQFIGGTNAHLLRAGNNSTVTGNYFNQTGNHPALNVGNGTTATNITITGNTFIKTNSASEPQNYAIVAEVSGSSWTAAATQSVLIANNTFQGRALTSLGSAKFGLNSFGGTAIQGTFGDVVMGGDVQGRQVVSGTNAGASYTITVTGVLGQGSGDARSINRVNLVYAISTVSGHIVRGVALYTSQYDGSAVLYATLGTDEAGGTITFGTSGNNPTVAITNTAGGTAAYQVWAVPLI